MTDKENPPSADAPDPVGEDKGQFVGPTTSAMQELATILSSDRELTPEDLREKPVELESERADAPIDYSVIIPASVLIAIVVAWGLLSGETFSAAAKVAFSWVLDNLGWAFVFFGTVFVAFVLTIAFGRFGNIRLGSMDEQPEFRTSSWIAMMFAAGMGIGLMFYGASEPLSFYRDGVPGHAKQEVGTAMATAMFHWTLHPWAVYAIVGLAIAYSTYRVGRKQLISAAFTPFSGGEACERVVWSLHRHSVDLCDGVRYCLLAWVRSIADPCRS